MTRLLMRHYRGAKKGSEVSDTACGALSVVAGWLCLPVVALPGPTSVRDPADRLIVASCRVLGLPLLTRDARILRSRLVTRWNQPA